MVLSTTWLLTFLSTPSARRATGHGSLAGDRMDISIHARREEGDTASPVKLTKQKIFLSTPSARRATPITHNPATQPLISIHALREEGDFFAIR